MTPIETFTKTFHERVNSKLKLAPQKIDLFLAAFWTQNHILLQGPPGTGKSTLAICLGEMIGDWKRIQMNAETTPADILGSEVLISTHPPQLEFRKGPIFKELLMVDEINRAIPRTQSALLQAMEEKRVDIGEHSFDLSSHFFVVATQNPVDYDGTFMLPMSQLDRFGLSLHFPLFEGKELENALAFSWSNLDLPKSEVQKIETPAHQHLIVDNDWNRVISGLQAHLNNAATEQGLRPQSLRAWKTWMELGSSLSQIRGHQHLSNQCLRELLIPVLEHRMGPLSPQDWQSDFLKTFDKLTQG